MARKCPTTKNERLLKDYSVIITHSILPSYDFKKKKKKSVGSTVHIENTKIIVKPTSSASSFLSICSITSI